MPLTLEPTTGQLLGHRHSNLAEGAASSTDNAIVRFDGTTGKRIQNSSVTVSDAGAVTIAGTGQGLLNVNGVNPDATSNSIANFETSWTEKLVFWGDADEGYTRLEFRPERRTGSDASDVQLVVHRLLAGTSTEHKHLSYYTSDAAGTPTKRFNLEYGVNKADYEILNCRVIIADIDDEAALTIHSAIDGTAAISNAPGDYTILIDSVQTSSNYKGLLGVAESIVGTVNAGIGVVDEGLGGAQGMYFATGTNSALAEALRITNGTDVRMVKSLRVGSLSAATNTTAGDVTFVRGFVTGSSGTLNITAATDGGDFNIYHAETGTKTLAIYGSSGNTMNLNLLDGELQVAGTKVVGARVVDARIDDAINSGDATTDGVIDAIRDALIAHGLIAAS